MTRRLDEKWQKLQEETFLNWINSILKGPLKTGDLEVHDLSKDLRDGRVLITLLNNLCEAADRKDQVKVRNKNPRLPVQIRENLTSCFEFMKKENIKLVNIGKYHM